MASVKTVKGTVATAIAAQGAANWVLQGLIDARVKVMLDTYVPDASEASGSKILMGQILPAGANVLGFLLSSDANSGASVQIGDGASSSRYTAAISIGSAQATFQVPVIASAGYIIGTNTGDNQIQLLTSGATLTAAKNIFLATFYTFD